VGDAFLLIAFGQRLRDVLLAITAAKRAGRIFALWLDSHNEKIMAETRAGFEV